MIVKCKQLYNPNTKQFEPGQSNNWLTIGNLYSVLEIYFNEEQLYYRIFPDEAYDFSYPGLIRTDDFEVISCKIPSSWSFIRDDCGAVLGPKMWNTFEPWEESFWQDYDNFLPKAKKCFDDEVRIIFDTDPDYIKKIDRQCGREPYFK